MRKKYLIKTAFLCLLTASFMLSGCEKQTAEKPEESREETEKPEDDKDKDDEDEAPANEPSEETSGQILLTRNAYADNIGIYDIAKNEVKMYDRKSLYDDLSSDEKEIYEIYGKPDHSCSKLECYGDGFLFFSGSRTVDDENTYFVYALNIDNGNIYDVWKGNSESFIQCCDYYDGKIYIDYFLGYDDEGNTLGYTEICLGYDEKTDSFEEKKLKISGILDTAHEEGISLRGSAGGPEYDASSLTQAYEECGFVLGNKESDYVTVDKKGNITKLPNLKNVYVYAYNKTSMIYIQYDDSYVNGTVCIYDVKSGSSKPVSGEAKSVTFLGQRENEFYYSLNDIEEYGIAHNYIYRYDSDEDESVLLYDETYVPGSGVTPGTEGFAIGDSCVCYAKFDSSFIKWFTVDTKRFSEPEELYAIGSVDIFDYGTVDYISNTSTCNLCESPIEENYCEYFILDDSLSEYAEDINEVLENTAILNATTSDEAEFTEEECKEHQEHPDWYLTTDDVTVSKVSIISDDFLAVNMSGYWYAGGAHGYPSRNQYLFDLNTGEIVTIKDFYTGKEKDFKKLIAEKTKEDYLSYDYYSNPYFAQDEETVYKDAYEYASLDSGCIEFTQDGIYYYYPPYDMGPYASGFIDVFISYEDLLGRDYL